MSLYERARRHAIRMRFPEGGLFWISHDFGHVVAGAEAELLQGELGGHGSGAAEARSDDFQRHGFFLSECRPWDMLFLVAG